MPRLRLPLLLFLAALAASQTPSPTVTPSATPSFTPSPSKTASNTFTPAATPVAPLACSANAGWICPLVGTTPISCGNTGDGGPPWLAKTGRVVATGFAPNGASLALASNLGYLRIVYNVSAPSASTRIWTLLGNGTAWPAASSGSVSDVSTWAADGPLAAVRNTSALSAGVLGVTVASSGVVYFTDSFQHRLRAIYGLGDGATSPLLANAYVQTLAGNGTQGLAGNGGPAAAALLFAPTFLALDEVAGVLYIVDQTVVYATARIRALNLTSLVLATVAGCNVCGGSGLGSPALATQALGIFGLATKPGSGLVFFSYASRYACSMSPLARSTLR